MYLYFKLVFNFVFGNEPYILLCVYEPTTMFFLYSLKNAQYIFMMECDMFKQCYILLLFVCL